MRFEFSRPPIVVPSKVQGPTGSASQNWSLTLLGFNPEQSTEVCSLTTASGVIRAPIVRVEAITVLGVTRTDFPVAAHSLPPHANVAGLLGTDFLRDLVVVINFKKRWVEFK